MKHPLLLPAIQFAMMIWLVDGAHHLKPQLHSPASRIQQRFLSTPTPAEEDFTYNKIIAMQNKTFTHECFVAFMDGVIFANHNTPYPIVWCDINVPLGLNVTAELRDGTCDQFTDSASSDYFTMGVASPILVPEVSEEEKKQGRFDHSYCAGMDILYDVNGTGNAVSVISRRFAMEVRFGYEEKVEEVIIDDTTTGEVSETIVVKEILTSVQLVDENTKATDDRKMELGIGLGVLAGAMVTIALIAIIYGGRRKASARRRWEAHQRELGMEDNDDHEVEIARINSATDRTASISSGGGDGNEII